MTFGATLTALRKSKGLSQEQLAEKLGLTRQTISKWELNQSSPDINYIIQLSDFFGVSADCLIKGEQAEVSPSCAPERQPNQVKINDNTYKLCVFAGSIIAGASLIGIIVFVICSALNPWGATLGRWYFEGLAGFLLGTGTLWFFIILTVIFIAGISATVHGINNITRKPT